MKEPGPVLYTLSETQLRMLLELAFSGGWQRVESCHEFIEEWLPVVRQWSAVLRGQNEVPLDPRTEHREMARYT